MSNKLELGLLCSDLECKSSFRYLIFMWVLGCIKHCCFNSRNEQCQHQQGYKTQLCEHRGSMFTHNKQFVFCVVSVVPGESPLKILATQVVPRSCKVKAPITSNVMISTNFSNDDFFAKDFHGVVHPCGLLFDQNHFSKCSFPKQLQVVKITHSLQKEW